MIIDGQLLFDGTPGVGPTNLTTLTAGTASPSANVLDFSNARDLGVSEPLKLFAVCTTPPASGTAGATVTTTLQGSPDNVNWTTIETYVSTVPATPPTGAFYLVRSQLPVFGSIAYRYLRLEYTASAALTAGAVEAGIVLNTERNPAYPRNYVA